MRHSRQLAKEYLKFKQFGTDKQKKGVKMIVRADGKISVHTSFLYAFGEGYRLVGGLFLYRKIGVAQWK